MNTDTSDISTEDDDIPHVPPGSTECPKCSSINVDIHGYSTSGGVITGPMGYICYTCGHSFVQ